MTLEHDHWPLSTLLALCKSNMAVPRWHRGPSHGSAAVAQGTLPWPWKEYVGFCLLKPPLGSPISFLFSPI